MTYELLCFDENIQFFFKFHKIQKNQLQWFGLNDIVYPTYFVQIVFHVSCGLNTSFSHTEHIRSAFFTWPKSELSDKATEKFCMLENSDFDQFLKML